MLEKTGMLELTSKEVEDIEHNGVVPSRLKTGWNLEQDELKTLVKSGEYRLLDEETKHD